MLEGDDARELSAAADSLTKALLEVANVMQAYVVRVPSPALRRRIACTPSPRVSGPRFLRPKWYVQPLPPGANTYQPCPHA